ncbi:MAG TPA: DUF2846 domain-containing protein [Stellaceae bacterium]|jgi:hypothetical protein
MYKNVHPILRSLKPAAPAGLLLAIAGCVQQATMAAVSIPPVRPGAARIWVYRAYEPYAGKGLPAVDANGGYLGQAQLGGVFYRDVAPGAYHVTVESFGKDINQSANLDLAAGQQKYVKIVSLPSWVEGGDRTAYERPTFYAWLMPPQVAAADVAHLAFYGGS